MFTLDHPQKNPLFDFYAPLGPHYRGLLSIPHSGENIPQEFEKFLSGDTQAYKEDVDFKVNELVDIKKIQESGVAVLVANVHRICVDLNRAESNCLMFWKNNTQGKSLVIQDPDSAASQNLIEKFYHPYYEILKAALKDLEKRKSGLVSMVDLHSMPSSPTEYHMKQNPNQQMHRPDFCVSDRKGKTAQSEFTQYFRDHLTSSGFEASLNDPYVGGYITEYVDQFRTNNIQIEIKRAIYMDESTKELVPAKVDHLKPLLTTTLIEGFKKFDS
jgi:N-formylglutamate amidohydrolase